MVTMAVQNLWHGMGRGWKDTDLFTCTIWVHFECQISEYDNFSNQKMIVNISRHVLWFVCFPAQTLPSSGFLVAHFKVYSYLYSSVNGSEDGSKCWYWNCFSEIVMWKKGSVGVLVMTGLTC